jgi:hypothetical protein
MFVTTSGRSGAPKAQRTATYDGTIIYNDPVLINQKVVWKMTITLYSFILSITDQTLLF